MAHTGEKFEKFVRDSSAAYNTACAAPIALPVTSAALAAQAPLRLHNGVTSQHC